MGRKILAVVCGAVTAWGIILIGKMVATGGASVVEPTWLENMSRGETAAYFSSQPMSVYVTLLLASIIGAFLGGFIVGNMGRREGSGGPGLALVLAAVLILGGIINFFVLLPGQPLWLVILTLLSYVPVTLLGHRFSYEPPHARSRDGLDHLADRGI